MSDFDDDEDDEAARDSPTEHSRKGSSSRVSGKSFTPPETPPTASELDEQSFLPYDSDSESESETESEEGELESSSSIGHSGTITSELTSSVAGRGLGGRASRGGFRSGGETSNYGDDESVDADSEDDLPPPPAHLLAKSKHAANFNLADLDAGLNLKSARTVVTADANPGDRKVQVKSELGFQVGMVLEIGEGPFKESVVLTGFGSFIFDRPLRRAWPAGTVVVGAFGKALEPWIEAGTPASSVISSPDSSQTPPFEPEEPGTPSSYKYSAVMSPQQVPSPPGSISGFSLRSQQARLYDSSSRPAPRAFFDDVRDDLSPHPDSITSTESMRYAARGMPTLSKKRSAAAKVIEAVKDGYCPIKAKFESIGGQDLDDPLEDMYYLYSADDNCIRLIVESTPHEVISIPIVKGRTFLLPNEDDPLHCQVWSQPFDGPELVLSFLAASPKAMSSFIKEMPSEMLDYPEEEEEDDDEPAEEKKRDPDAKFSEGGKDTSHFGNLKQLHKAALRKRRKEAAKNKSPDAKAAGSGEEEVLEGEEFGAPPGPPPDDLEDDFLLPPSSRGFGLFGATDKPPPPPRTELVASRIRKSTPSVRRVRLLCRWLDLLRFWPTKVLISNVHKEFCTGLLLIELMKKLIPSTTFVNVNKSALSKHAACQNLNQALTVIFQSKTFNASRIPSPDDIFNGNVAKITTLVDEIFNVYVRGPLYQSPSLKMLNWYHTLLRAYQLGLPREIIEEGDVSSRDQLWKHFHSGVAIFCILFHFFGANKIPICPRHGNHAHQGEIAPIEAAEWSAAPPHIREITSAWTIEQAVMSINKEVADKWAKDEVGTEYEEDEYAHSFTLEQLEKIIGLEDAEQTKSIVKVLVHFHRLAETETRAHVTHYQVYCHCCAAAVRLDPMRVVKRPVGLTDVKANVTYVFSLLKALNIDLIFEVDEWITLPDADFILLQLTYIYDALKHRQGVLPAASGGDAGYTSGPNGETIIVGMVFADTNPVTKILPAIERSSKTVILGAGYHDVPFTPIDSSIEEDAAAALKAKAITSEQFEQISRFHIDECPLGLLSDHVTMARSSHSGARFTHKPRKTAPWNGQSSLQHIDEDARHHEVISILKQVHKKTDSSSAHSISKATIVGDDGASVVDQSKLGTKERQSKLDKKHGKSSGSSSAALPASPKRRYSVTAVNKRDGAHHTVMVDSEEQEEMIRWDLMRGHKKHVLRELADDVKKAETQLEIAEEDLAIRCVPTLLFLLPSPFSLLLTFPHSFSHFPFLPLSHRLEDIDNEFEAQLLDEEAYEREKQEYDEDAKAIADDRERVTRFFKMRRDAIEDQFNEFKMRSVKFAVRPEDAWTVSSKNVCSSELLVPAPVGATTLDLVSTKGFKLGMTVEVGTGAQQDRVRVSGITTLVGAHDIKVDTRASVRSSVQKVVTLDAPLKSYHPRGTPVVGVEAVSILLSGGAGAASQAGAGEASGAAAGASPGRLTEKMKGLSSAAQGRGAAAKQVKHAHAGAATVSIDSSWDQPDDKLRRDADVLLKQVHLNHYMPRPTVTELREHVVFDTQEQEREARRMKDALDKRFPGNGITLAYVGQFVDHCKKTKQALDKRFHGNGVPLEYVEEFVCREMKSARQDEKGWNLASTKLHTYNAKVKRLTDDNSRALQDSWKTVRQREKEEQQRAKDAEKMRSMLGLHGTSISSLHPDLRSAAEEQDGAGSVASSMTGRSSHAPPALHSEVKLSRAPEDVFRRFQLSLIAQNHIFGKKQGAGLGVAPEDDRNVAERAVDKLIRLGLPLGTKGPDDQWVHRREGDVKLQTVQRVFSDVRRILAGRERDPLLKHLLQVQEEEQDAGVSDELGAEPSEAVAAIGRKVRDEELMCLLFEDVRAELLNEPGRRKAQDPTPPPPPPPLPDPAIIPSRLAAGLSEYELRAKEERERLEAKRQREDNIEAAMMFLGEQRLLSLADRHLETPFFFVVLRPSDRQPVASAAAGQYVLVWSKPSSEAAGAPGEELERAGQLSVTDIKSAVDAPGADKRSTATISIDPSNARALMGCGGRTKLVLRGEAGVVEKFVQRLVMLQANLS